LDTNLLGFGVSRKRFFKEEDECGIMERLYNLESFYRLVKRKSNFILAPEILDEFHRYFNRVEKDLGKMREPDYVEYIDHIESIRNHFKGDK